MGQTPVAGGGQQKARTLGAFALILAALFFLHLPLLRLPYFWDEAGYFIPAARDLLLTGDPIPQSTLSNAHPPLVMAWLALWWKLAGYAPAVTRTAMLLLAAFALLGVHRLARQVAHPEVAAAALIATAVHPVFFMQSVMAHLDMAAAGFTLWALADYVSEHRMRAAAWFGLAALSKETAIVTPLVLLLWEAWQQRTRSGGVAESLRRSWPLLLPVFPLGLWLAYHSARTGYVFGNPEFVRYNVEATLDPLRMVIAAVRRLWHTLGHGNLIVLTAAAALAMRRTPLADGGVERQRIAVSTQSAFAAVIAAHVVMLSVIGGALLARYVLPVVPLVVLICVSTLRRRVARWRLVVAAACLAMLAGWFIHPPWPFAPEDNLAWRDYVLLHKRAADFLSSRYGSARVLTAWPATDELSKPYLGYVAAPLRVVAVENFSRRHADAAAEGQRSYDLVLAFSTKYQPSFNLLHRLPAWESLESRFFGYHGDVMPDEAARLFRGKVVFSEQRRGQWVAVVEVE
ncbi:MAG: glycosyltransferase family 39 protein [Acidobacteria bacterium]|nr:glycosyltransferase family 39 protein [Acidobacteriota bacterium]